MKKNSPLTISFLISLCVSVILISCSTDPYEPPPLMVVTLEGTPYNRGLIHGQTLTEEINIVIQRWEETVESTTSTDFVELRDTYLRTTRYVDAILEWNADLMDEVRGIADGSGIEFETMFLFQIGEELLSNYGYLNLLKCTSIGVNKTDDAPCYVAQNMDPPPFLHGFPTLLHVKHEDSDLESYVFTSPGLLALNGMNNRAIGITCNGLPDLHVNHEGLPVTFIIRTVLEQRSFDDAVNFLRKINHAKAQNYIIGGINETVCLECFADIKARFIPAENPSITYHTNNYIALEHESNSDYCSRLTTVREEIALRDYLIDFNDIQDILSSTEWNMGRPISHAFTYGSTIMVLSDFPVLYLAPDQPDKTSYLRFDFGRTGQIDQM